MTQDVLAKLVCYARVNRLGLFKIAIASSCLMIAPQVQVKAASIAIQNHSFEAQSAPLQQDGYYSINSITGWSLHRSDNRNQGVFNPSASQSLTGSNFFYNQPVPDGNQVAYNNGGMIVQTLSAVLQPNTRYTLGVYVGRRNVLSFPGYSIQLSVGNTLLASNNSITPLAGTFAHVTVNYTSGSSDPLIGRPLQIRLASLGAQTNFDNVTLHASPIPEPSAILGLLGFGLLGIGSKLQQKR